MKEQKETYCPNCGERLFPDSKFCSTCGADLLLEPNNADVEEIVLCTLKRGINTYEELRKAISLPDLAQILIRMEEQELVKNRSGAWTITEKGKRKIAGKETKKVASVVKTMELDGFIIPIATNIDEFCKIAATNRACVIFINTKDYFQIMQKAFSYFSAKFGENSDFTRAVSSGRLICGGCNWEFPGSYTLSLMTPGLFGERAFVFGGTPGFKEFGRIGICPKCGSRQSFYVYDNLSGEEITQSDVNAIRQYERYLARQWWKREPKARAYCGRCSSPVLRDAGYLTESGLYCEECYDRMLGSDALEHLRKNPNYVGSGKVRKARHFVANR